MCVCVCLSVLWLLLLLLFMLLLAGTWGRAYRTSVFFKYIMSAYVEASAEIVFFKRDSNINICCYNYFWS